MRVTDTSGDHKQLDQLIDFDGGSIPHLLPECFKFSSETFVGITEFRHVTFLKSRYSENNSLTRCLLWFCLLQSASPRWLQNLLPQMFLYSFNMKSNVLKGGRRRPYDALIFPAPSPTSAPRRHARSWCGMAILSGEAGRGQVQGTNAHPTTHSLNQKPPIAPPPVLLAGLHHKKVGGERGKQHRWGRGLGSLGAPCPDSTPSPQGVSPPPSDVRADCKHGPRKEGGSVGLRKQAEVVAFGSAT